MNGWFEATLGAAFLAGLAGGAHCAAMCGGLVGIASGARARELSHRTWWQRALAYNAGRIASYVAAGALTGALGAAGLSLRGTPLVQQTLLALMSGALIVLGAYVGGVAPLVRTIESAGAAFWRRIEPHSRRFLPADSAPRAFGLGMVWGWLPCGMVYAALIAALATADPWHGAPLMLAFGLGTLPNLLAIGASFGYVARVARSRAVRTVFAVLIVGVGVFGMVKATQPAHAPDGLSAAVTVLLL
ncbi:MAG: sulfite exporter TauE/SafE family protein [Betaproteobacteria bacterium]|nr:sulfite exporter TauE/SafE family protein [Betaproteobacteria bacterium]MDH3437708.1 sulfite exporter TauE/SafE family protein [Betaproteobacteria bacterium]